MKILLYDIESFPNVGWTWGTWDQRVIEVIQPRMVCSVAWQWYPEKEKHVLALPDFPGYNPKNRTNRALIKAFSKEYNKADIVIGHNVVDFDDPMVNTDILKHDFKPPPHHRSIDTLKICRRRFRFNSNRLDDICAELGLVRKVKHPGFAMWKGCMEGDKKSWALMKKYNVGDVDPCLRSLYERVRPWIPNHPNLAMFGEKKGCPSCGYYDLKPDGYRYTQAGKYQRMVCKKCFSMCKAIKVRGAIVFRP